MSTAPDPECCWEIRRTPTSRYGAVHVPTGCRIATFRTEEAAQQFIAAIADLTDWRRARPASDHGVLSVLRAAAARIGAEA